MGNIRLTIVNFIMLTTFTLVFLFDADGAQVGLSIWPNISSTFIDVISIVGNIVWLFGVMFLLMAGAMIYYIGSEGIKAVDDAIDKSMKDKKIDLPQLKRPTIDKIMTYVSLPIYLIGIGSGFWFTATASLFLTVSSMIFIHLFVNRVRERIAEGEVGKSPQDLAANPLT